LLIVDENYNFSEYRTERFSLIKSMKKIHEIILDSNLTYFFFLYKFNYLKVCKNEENN